MLQTVVMIASILEQQVEVDQVEAVVEETPQKTVRSHEERSDELGMGGLRS